MFNKKDDLLQAVDFNYPSKKSPIKLLTVCANDGRHIQYRFKEYLNFDDKELFLKEVISPNSPKESYRYELIDFAKRKNLRRLIEKRRHDNRFLQIQYYKLGKNDYLKIDKHNPILGRVQHLLAPVGTDATPHITHRFHYDWIESTNVVTGCAVFDAHGNCTKYGWDKNLRLTSTKRLLKNKPYTIDRLYWGKKSNVGNLISRVYSSANDALFCKTYKYDTAGNITKECFYGHITGKNPVPLRIDEEGNPIETGCDRIEKSYVYSEDGRNLLLWEAEGSQAKSYLYYPETDLVAMTCLISHGQIKQRHCYYYDENCALSSEIIDDGVSNIPLELTGVTFRKIRLMTPRKSFPIGVPDTIEEYYQDMTTGNHCLQKAFINSYSIEGWLTRQDCYDADRNYCYSLFWEYNALGNITKEINALGQVVVREFDAHGNKVSEQGPNFDYCKKFTYDYSNRLIREDEIHPTITLTAHHAYNLLSQKVSTIDCFGNETKFIYDKLGRLVHTIAPHDANGRQATTSFSHDYLDNQACVVDPKGNATITFYTAKGKPNHITHPDGTKEHFTYYLNGPLESHLDCNGCLTKYYLDYQDRLERKEFYTPDGALKWVTSSTYNAFHLLSETDAMGNTTYYTYNLYGRKKSVSCNDSLETYDYDSLGRLSKKAVHYGFKEHEVIVYTYQYDLLDRITQERTEDAFGNVLEKTEKRYDSEGRVIFETTYNENGLNTIETRYDSHGTPIEVIDPLGNVTNTVVHYNYQLNNQLVLCTEITDALGNTTVIIKDALNRDSMEIRKNALGGIIQQRIFEYDLNGNLEKVTEKVFGAETYDVQTLHFYDEMNRLKLTIDGANSPDQRCTHYHYNHHGQLQSIQKPSGIFIHHAYTPEGLLARFLASDDSFHYTFEYDLNQNLTASHDILKGTSTLRYYEKDRLIEEKQATGLTVKYTYDRLDRIASLTLPDQSLILYDYTQKIAAVSRLNSQKQLLYRHTFDSYDGSGNCLEQTMIGKAGKITKSFDSNNRLQSLTTPQSSEKLYYDAVGNLIARNLNDTQCKYTYDDLYQITAEDGLFSHTYSFDSLYNRLSKDEATTSYNNLNQLQDPGYKYDLDGRLIQTPTSTYAYDALDRLISVTKDSQTTHYTYDSFNRRLSKSSTLFLYDGQKEIGSYVNNELQEFRVLIPSESESGAAIAIELGAHIFAPVHDITGSVSHLIALDGTLTCTYRYSVFGEERPSSSLNPWRFASKRVDPESGLSYFGRRYYDASLGRWITPDPIGYDGGPNLYAYVSNNPLTHFDAFGLFEEEVQTKASPEAERFTAPSSEGFFRSSFNNVRDFGYGAASGWWDPISTGYDYYSGNYHDKSWGRIAGETVGVLSNFNPLGLVKSGLRQTAKLSVPLLVKSVNWMRGAANLRTMKNMAQVGKVAMASEKLAQISSKVQNVALQTNNLKAVVKTARNNWRFPSNPADLLKDIPRNKRGIIYVTDNLRIRPEKHLMKPGESFCARHHNQHYHVKYKIPGVSWSKNLNIRKIKPENYIEGTGTGFLPGEFFPGV